MVFITLGSQKFPFDRLLQRVDELVGQGAIADEVFAQTGYSTYEPQGYASKPFLDRDEFAMRMAAAHVVITHAGTGAIMGALKAGCKVIAVPRLARYGEHVDDHQVQLIGEFEGMGIIEACYDVAELGGAYRRCLAHEYARYESNTATIVDDLARYLDSEVR